MPPRDDHLAKAEHNERFAQHFDLATTPYRDWVVTSLFYSAVHYVEAYLATRGQHSTDHRVRDSQIYRDANLTQIYNEYNDLKNDSINARYYLYQFTPTEVHNHAIPNHLKVKTLIASLV
jgi:hypothetical protein